MSDTPRTDVEAEKCDYLEFRQNASEIVHADFARTFERELAESEQKRKETAKDFEVAFRLVRKELSEVTADRDITLVSLLKYGQHTQFCGVWNDNNSLCTCGFTAILEALND